MIWRARRRAKLQRRLRVRVIIMLIAAILVLAWLGIELRDKHRDVSFLLFAVSGLLAFLLVGAFFGMGA